MTLTENEVTFIVETLKNIRLEYEDLQYDNEWFVSDSPDMIASCLEILGETTI